MSMRTMKLYLNIFIAMVAMFAVVGCTNEPEPTPAPPKNDVPLVSADVESIGVTTLEFSITSSSADEVRYIFSEGSATAPTKETILAEGTAVEANKTVHVTFEDLAPFTKYTLHVVAKNATEVSYVYQEAVTEESNAPKPTIAIILEKYGMTSAMFTVETTNATNVSYNVYEVASMDPDMPEGELPSAEEVFEGGEAIEANAEVVVDVTDLDSGVTYLMVIAAKGEGGSVVDAKQFTTLNLKPTLSATLTEDIGYDYAVFTVEAEYVEEIKYVAIKAGSRDVTADQVLKNGTAVEIGEVRVDGLSENTAYEVYVAAKGLNGDVVMADVLRFTTTKDIMVYEMNAESTTASSIMFSDVNYYITFIDEAAGYTLKGDFYCDSGNTYLPTGTYNLGGSESGEISKAYTSFMFTPYDSEVTKFASGYIDVVAEPNEESREVYYTMYGELYFEDGNYVVLNYSSLIANISLPAIEKPESDYYEFVVSPSTNMPKRIHGSSIAAGEYYIKFYDSNWNELNLDLRIDPALCNNGKSPLPAGIYSTADGLLDTYSSINLYNPYFGANFTEAELEVSRDGDIYTFKLSGIADNGSETKLIKMEYTGEIVDMTL